MAQAPTEAELLGLIGSVSALNELWDEEIEAVSALIDCCDNATAICGKHSPSDSCTLMDSTCFAFHSQQPRGC